MAQILGIFFNPPMAIARLGSSATPLESYTWAEDPSMFGAGKTVIRPAISLEVQDDGSVRPYLPSLIRFRDGALLRPVAPFFELWAQVVAAPGAEVEEVPLTLAMLEDASGSLDGVTYHVTAANRKAARRTGDPSCSFSATIDVRGTDHRQRALLASSPRSPGAEPLVSDQRPIPLGHFQAIRPIRALRPSDDAARDPAVKPAVEEMGVDLGTLRVRFTPARGEVYGPPAATTAPVPGTNRMHEIVAPENRILNQNSSWTAYDGDYAHFNNPEPSDTYDGADIDKGRSWGVVDDTCDLLIKAYVVVNGIRLQAVARAFTGPPDYAPDRRHFISLADDLSDRDKPFIEPVDDENDDLTIAEVSDLFQRVFETVSLTNLDQLRTYSIRENRLNDVTEPDPPLPLTDDRMMTKEDEPYADTKLTDIVGQADTAHARLPYATAARQIHEAMADVENVVALLSEGGRVRLMLRPPYARLRELAAQPDPAPDPYRLRDARNPRDNAQDMRMPPYMRSDTATSLSLTRGQYDEILKLTDFLSGRRGLHLKAVDTAGVAEPSASSGRPDTPLWRHVARVVERHGRRAASRDHTGQTATPSEQREEPDEQ